jgi:hypothetical protein
LAHDISILFPAASRSDLELPVKADALGTGGDLIPADVYSLLPQVRLNPSVPNRRDETFAFGIRANCDFDPQRPTEPCHGQLQLSFQLASGVSAPVPPGVPDGGVAPNPLVLQDASIHAIYGLNDDEFRTLVAELVALRVAHGGIVEQPLGVHPILSKQGGGGAFAQGLRAIVLKYAGERTLKKVTFITIEAPALGGEAWKFGVFEKKNGAFRRVAIPTLAQSGDEQLVRSPLVQQEQTQFETEVSPAMPQEGDLTALFGRFTMPSTAQQSAAAKAYELALQIENPLKRSPNDTDCASCHLTHARARGEQVFGQSAQGQTSAFPANGLTTNVPVRSPVNVRAFGYGVFARPRQDATASISSRVVNETAYTLEYLNR